VSRTYHHGERKIRVRGVRRRTDVKRLARALIELEYQQAQAEAQAETEYQQKAKKGKQGGSTTKSDRKDAA
jgi:hypothetical protein